MASQRDLVNAAAALSQLSPPLRACAAKTAMNELVHSQSPTHLLGIPAELRIKIFELAVIEDHAIGISPTTSTQPGILRTSRQTRKEAIYLYYDSNKFQMLIDAHDGAAFQRFYAIVHDYMSPTKRPSNLTIILSGPPSWKNLMIWMRTAREGRVWGTISPGIGDFVADDLKGVHTLFKTMDQAMRDLPWKKVEEILTELRPMQGLLNKGWLDD